MILASLPLAALLWSASPALQVPANDGWVTDLAGFLEGHQEEALEQLMESYRVGSGQEIALLTVPSLEGAALEGFALEVGRAWGLGREGVNDGALVLVVRDSREIRIEVGRGLEGTLTDSVCGRVIRGIIAPEFRDGRYYAGLRAGIEALHAAAGGDYGLLRSQAPEKHVGGALTGCLGILFWIFLFRSMIGRRRGGAGSVLPWLLLSGMGSGRHGGGGGGGGFGGGGFGGFGGGGGFSGGGASGGW